MKIGIDAKWLFTGHISGRLFIQNVLPELLSLHPEIEWHIFLDAKDKDQPFPFSKENVHLHYIWADFNMLSNLFIIPRHAKRLHLDAVLFQTFSAKKKSFQSLVFIHDILYARYPQYFSLKERLYFKIVKRSLSSADRVITTTQYVKDELTAFHYLKKDQPVDLAPSGVTRIFQPAALHDQELLKKIKLKFNLPDYYLLFAGRLNVRKNIKTLITALPYINDKKISLVIAGEKDQKAPQLNSFLDDPALRSRIFFTGFLTDEELSGIYAMAKIFCFPTFAEGFGLPPLEAMSSGIPVVISDTTSLPEVCGQAALYADPHDPKTIAKRINELLENETLYKQKVQEGLAWSANYTWTRTAKGIMKSVFATIGGEL
jgi:glycosyltransferase involved in cell wall biosynthesis